MYTLTEEEQAEQVKAWLRNYGSSIILGVVLALIFVFGWRYWQKQQENMRINASSHYESLLTSLVNHNTGALQYHANQLLKDYTKTPYAKLAAFMLARQAVHEKKLAVAEEKLQWIIDKANEAELRQIARIRLARVLIANNKLPQALAILHVVEQQSFVPEVAEVRGDIYVKMGNSAKARDAYAQALQLLPDSENNKSLLQMKYANLT